jgi:putative tricarboxylic transport membrane protein
MITDRDQLSSLFWLAISIFVCVESIQIHVGTFRSPGPGFLPFWSGIALGALAMILAVTSFLKKEREKITEQWIDVKWSKVILVLASLFVYSILLTRLGYLITTFGLMLFLFSLTERPRMWSCVGSAILTSLVTYLIFYIWLGVELPKGILGF